MTRTAIFPGSFDPIHGGHIDLINRGLQVFDTLLIAVGENPKKEYLLSLEERIELVKKSVPNPNVMVDSFGGLLVDYAKAKGVKVILRGLRAVSDFEYELSMANMNKKLHPDIETLFMMTSDNFFFLRSNTVKEIACFGADLTGLVPKVVQDALKEKFK